MGGLRVLRAARATYAQVEGRIAPFYALASALGMAVPLLVGALTGHATQGATIALAAFLVAFTAPSGPYGSRARSLATAAVVVALGATAGGLLSGHPWLAVTAVPPVVALTAVVPWMGPAAGLAMVLAAVRPHSGDLLYVGFLELLGGLWVSLLFLAPWPLRRLRPLRTALTDAATAVAEALDAVAQDIGGPDGAVLDAVHLDDPELAAVAGKPDWEKRRRAASEALNAARTTFALYRAGGEPTRPERLIEAFSRILHETVALRALVEAIRQRPPHKDWELEVHVAITALAARLRLLAGAMVATEPTPLGSPESAAVRRLARQSERIQRAGLAGEDDLVAAALVTQVRRTVDRIARTVDSSRRIVADGLRIAPGLRLRRTAPVPARPSLPARMVSAVRTGSPEFRQVVRIWVVVVLAMAVSTGLEIPHGHWLTITVLLSLRGTYGETVARVVQRVGGTAIGAMIAALLLVLAPGQEGAATLIFCCALLGFGLRSVNYGWWALFGTPLVMMLLDFSEPAGWEAAGVRIGLTIAGGIMALLAARLLWPAGTVQLLPGRLARMLTAHADLTRAAATVVEEPSQTLSHDRLTAAIRAAGEVTDAGLRLGHEPVPDVERIARLRDAVQAAQRVRDHLIAVARMSRTEIDDPGPVTEILDRVADHLDEGASAVGADDPDTEPLDLLDLAEQFTELDDQLASLARRNRAEAAGGEDLDHDTELRDALMQTAGLRYALHSLGTDTGSLTSATRT